MMAENDNRKHALEGITVLDFTRVLAGPYCTMTLSDLGAEIIKIENPKVGDESRTFRPPTFGDESAYFLAVNRNKKSLALNPATMEGQAVARDLVAKADVVIENYRTGVMERWGMDYDTLAAKDPSIVYCSISGYGQEGPKAGAAAYDSAIQAASGMITTTGYPENGPTRVGFTVVDMTTGITAAYAIASALFRREVTGEGQFLDVAMLDSALTQLGPLIANYTVAGEEPKLNGNASLTGLASAEQYACKEGYVLLAVLLDNQVAALFDVLGQPDLIEDPRFATHDARLGHYSDFRTTLEELFLAGTAANWVCELAAAGVPASELLTVPQAVEQPQLEHRNVIMDLPAPAGFGSPIRTIGSGFQSLVDTPGTKVPPPGIGEHTDEILTELGYDVASISSFRADGVI